MLQSGSSDVHSYEPTSKDIMTMSKSELFICVGGESDSWSEDVLKTINNDELKVLRLFESVEKLEESNNGIIQTEHHNHNEEHHHSYDEHIWTSVKNMMLMTESVRNSLVEIYDDKKDIINQNFDIYMGKLNNLESEYEQVCANKDITMIIADRFPFLYLTNDYNIKYNALFSTCSSESEATTDSIVKIIDKINEFEVKHIIVLENSQNFKTAQSIINDKKCYSENIEILTLNSCQAVVMKDVESIGYLDIMKRNLEVLKKVLEV
jgi:zinc transport system substrate-binding protein